MEWITAAMLIVSYVAGVNSAMGGFFKGKLFWLNLVLIVSFFTMVIASNMGALS